MQYTVTKRIEVAGSHRLSLPYESKCSNVHGHNWIIHIEVTCRELNNSGMVIDFSDIKKAIMRYDHQNLNEMITYNPTAENMARIFCEDISLVCEQETGRGLRCSKVTVQESEGNTACFIP